MRLIPVSQWTYHRYKVNFRDTEGGRIIATEELVSTDDHVQSYANERAGLIGGCEWYDWTCERENVRGPAVIGNLYGMPIHEDGWQRAKKED